MTLMKLFRSFECLNEVETPYKYFNEMNFHYGELYVLDSLEKTILQAI